MHICVHFFLIFGDLKLKALQTVDLLRFQVFFFLDIFFIFTPPSERTFSGGVVNLS
jgi:hypothetical protein